MPWYRFEARHGPGHQSKTVEYEWYEEPLDKVLLAQEYQNWVGRQDLEFAIGGATLEEELPEQVVDDKIAYYEAVIDEALMILKDLRKRRKYKPLQNARPHESSWNV